MEVDCEELAFDPLYKFLRFPIPPDFVCTCLHCPSGWTTDPCYDRGSLFGQNTSDGQGSVTDELLNMVGMPFMFFRSYSLHSQAIGVPIFELFFGFLSVSG